MNLFFFQFGIKLLRSFITRWFWDRFEKWGGLKVAQIVPVDKFRLENIDSYESFCAFVSEIAAERICFVNEKSLKGAELFNVKGWGDPLTGERPVHIVNPDFRNTYCVMGICSVNRRKLKPFSYNEIHVLIIYYLFRLFPLDQSRIHVRRFRERSKGGINSKHF